MLALRDWGSHTLRQAVEVGEDGEEKAEWEAQMGLHHVVEVGQRIVEFCDESE